MPKQDPPRRFYTVLFGAGILAVLAGGIAFVDWAREEPSRPYAASSAPSHETKPTERSTPSVVEAVTTAPATTSTVREATEAPVESANPEDRPPPDAVISPERPPRVELTEAETREKKQQAIALLDRTIERLEKELEGSDDPEVKVRLERMRKLREKRVAEVDGPPDAQ